ncbi:hypothetical protein [Rhizobium sp. CCGE 510]|uniref:hypothetical protein n=1 Tax=Rhizobium sp. CCGE 510 TaxID=1132836 RepID=UPI0012F68C70|nr:hypothetical protein [Rhizobium sp. CCGE 510]
MAWPPRENRKRQQRRDHDQCKIVRDITEFGTVHADLGEMQQGAAEQVAGRRREDSLES